MSQIFGQVKVDGKVNLSFLEDRHDLQFVWLVTLDRYMIEHDLKIGYVIDSTNRTLGGVIRKN